jgi:hypothetical protein
MKKENLSTKSSESIDFCIREKASYVIFLRSTTRLLITPEEDKHL